MADFRLLISESGKSSTCVWGQNTGLQIKNQKSAIITHHSSIKKPPQQPVQMPLQFGIQMSENAFSFPA
jgi:hypothetical protein